MKVSLQINSFKFNFEIDCKVIAMLLAFFK